MANSIPCVLCFSGHDPSGGAGIQADIESIASFHCHACSVLTALTEQDTHNVIKLIPQNPQNILAQAQTILNDITIDVIKIGLIGHYATAQVIHTILKTHPTIPVVLDPVLAAGGGTVLSNKQLITAINTLILPYTSLITPNSTEARMLAGQGLQTINECAIALLNKGCEYILVTAADEDTPTVSNQLFYQEKVNNYTWERLPFSYHGSGCTLAASIAALLAHGLTPLNAVQEAQAFTWKTLKAGFKPGQGQHLPNRFFWTQQNT